MRQQGYAVKITGFLPVDKSDLEAQKKAIDALLANDPAKVLAVLTSVAIEHKLTSRVTD